VNERLHILFVRRPNFHLSLFSVGNSEAAFRAALSPQIPRGGTPQNRADRAAKLLKASVDLALDAFWALKLCVLLDFHHSSRKPPSRFPTPHFRQLLRTDRTSSIQKIVSIPLNWLLVVLGFAISDTFASFSSLTAILHNPASVERIPFEAAGSNVVFTQDSQGSDTIQGGRNLPQIWAPMLRPLLLPSLCLPSVKLLHR
jgi:hypothetical protein